MGAVENIACSEMGQHVRAYAVDPGGHELPGKQCHECWGDPWILESESVGSAEEGCLHSLDAVVSLGSAGARIRKGGVFHIRIVSTSVSDTERIRVGFLCGLLGEYSVYIKAMEP